MNLYLIEEFFLLSIELYLSSVKKSKMLGYYKLVHRFLTQNPYNLRPFLKKQPFWHY